MAEQATAMNSVPGVSVRHQDLPVGEDSDISTKPGGLPHCKHQHVTNVYAESN
jgi:hypothetical protein